MSKKVCCSYDLKKKKNKGATGSEPEKEETQLTRIFYKATATVQYRAFGLDVKVSR